MKFFRLLWSFRHRPEDWNYLSKDRWQHKSGMIITPSTISYKVHPDFIAEEVRFGIIARWRVRRAIQHRILRSFK